MPSWPRWHPCSTAASSKVSEINGRVGALADAANSLAAQANAGTGLLGGLRDQLTNLQNRYLEFRAKYTDVRQTAVTALDRAPGDVTADPGLHGAAGCRRRTDRP